MTLYIYPSFVSASAGNIVDDRHARAASKLEWFIAEMFTLTDRREDIPRRREDSLTVSKILDRTFRTPRSNYAVYQRVSYSLFLKWSFSYFPVAP